MNKAPVAAIVLLLVTAIGAWFYASHTHISLAPAPIESPPSIFASTATSSIAASYKDATYTIDGTPITLANGISELSVPEAGVHIVTQYFGNEAVGDLNGDGVPDIAFILTQNAGGSGTFYYVVAALATATGYQGTNAILLGDRIAPQMTQIAKGQIIVNYADRAAGQPFTTPPSVGASKYLVVDGGVLKESLFVDI